MKKVVFALAVVVAFLIPQTVTTQESSRWDAHARNVTITRDDWGIAHIHGKTDADAAFGMIYAQA
ncbi:MAG: penicillin acylase family protein, partial [Acidobacteriota bacterium]